MKATKSKTSRQGLAVGCLVMRTVLGDVGKEFQRLQEFYIRKAGPEWAAKRAKAIWNVANLLRNGDKEKALRVCRENSISHRRTGVPKGIEGTVVRRYVDAERPVVIKRLAASLRWYTSIRLKEPTKAQKAKALRSISEPSHAQLTPLGLYQAGHRDMDRYLRFCARSAGCYSTDSVQRWIEGFKERVRKKVEPISYADEISPVKYYFSRYHDRDLEGSSIGVVKQHSLSGFRAKTRFPKMVGLIQSPYYRMCLSFMTEPWVPSVIDRRTPCFEMRQHIRSQAGWSNEDQRFAGRIAILQEQGAKPRIVAQPTAWLQLAFKPLHRTLAWVAEELFPRASMVRHQQVGANCMLNLQLKGKSLYCSDLSSATDRFPVQYSLGILDSLGLNEWASALSEVIQREFQCGWDPKRGIRYSVGQPMGLYGSFPLFHLSNLVTAFTAWSSVTDRRLQEGVRKIPELFYTGSPYLVLGDDIVFSDKRVAHAYNQRLFQLGVDRSESKCFEGRVAEFAGFMSVKTNKSVCTFRPYKPSDGSCIRNPLQFLNAIGAKVKNLKHRRAYWQRQWEAFQQTKPFRDLALESLIPNLLDNGDGPVRSSAFRGDSQTLVSMANAIAMTTEAALPDLSGSTRINAIPLFLERGMHDYYGYNPDLLRETSLREEREAPWKQTQKTLSQDPLLQMHKEGMLKDLTCMDDPLPSGSAGDEEELSSDTPDFELSEDEDEWSLD